MKAFLSFVLQLIIKLLKYATHFLPSNVILVVILIMQMDVHECRLQGRRLYKAKAHCPCFCGRLLPQHNVFILCYTLTISIA